MIRPSYILLTVTAYNSTTVPHRSKFKRDQWACCSDYWKVPKSPLICTEFEWQWTVGVDVQSDLEKLEGLPVAPFMDRDKVTIPSAQIGFIKFILLPLVESVTELFPNLTVSLSHRHHYHQHRSVGVVVIGSSDRSREMLAWLCHLCVWVKVQICIWPA